MDAKQVAKEAIAQAMELLGILANQDERWYKDSVPMAELNRLARELGYDRPDDIVAEIESDRRDDAEMWRGVFDIEEW